MKPLTHHIIKLNNEYKIIIVPVHEIPRFIAIYQKQIVCSGSSLGNLLQTFAGIV